MRPKAESAIDSEATRARGIIVLVKLKYLVKNIENKKNLATFCRRKALAFRY